MQGIIYLAVHVSSGRVYVGQTYSHKKRTQDQLLADRKTRHFRTAANSKSKKTHFARAIEKYGSEQFAWSILDFAESIERLNALESHYIHALRSSSDLNGFNSRLEGDNRIFTSGTKKVMAESALVRWKNISNDERTRLLAKQQQGRDRHPEIAESARVRMKALGADKDMAKKRKASLAANLKTPEFKKKRSAISKKYWDAATEADKKKQSDAMYASPVRLTNLRDKIKTNEYRKNLTAANRLRRKRAFVILALQSGKIVGEFENIVDAARALDSHAPNISVTLNGKGKSFTAKNPRFNALGKLTARWKDEMRPIVAPYDATRKLVDIFSATSQRLVASFKGVKIANATLGANIGSVLHGRTKTFRAKAAEFEGLGPLVAKWSSSDGENN